MWQVFFKTKPNIQKVLHGNSFLLLQKSNSSGKFRSCNSKCYGDMSKGSKPRGPKSNACFFLSNITRVCLGKNNPYHRSGRKLKKSLNESATTNEWKKVHSGRTMHCLPQRLNSMFFEIFASGGSPKETQSEENISKNVDFSLWGNHAITQTRVWNWNFLRVLAHCPMTQIR